jgi:CRP-like cAMP-binding protein
MKSVMDELQAHRFLEGMHNEHIRLLAECARLVELESGSFILRQGAEATDAYLICSGKVTVELFSSDGGPVVIQTLTAGDVLGWSWLVPPYHWRFDARAVESTRAIQMDAAILRSTFQDFPKFGYEILERFIRVIAERLEAERMKLISLYAAHS